MKDTWINELVSTEIYCKYQICTLLYNDYNIIWSESHWNFLKSSSIHFLTLINEVNCLACGKPQNLASDHVSLWLKINADSEHYFLSS